MKTLRILVVDDDHDFAEGIADALELEGHELAMAYSGEEALERFTETEFDIIFMDVKLPGKNGVESFLEIRRRFPGAKALMMTAYSMEHLVEQALDNGVMGVFHKPLAFDQILGLLNQLREGARVLIVDDDVDFARELRDVLEVAGYSTRSSFDGRTAIARCQEEAYDALILDLRLPDVTGLDVYNTVRSIHPNLLVIPITGYVDEESEAIQSAGLVSFKNVLRKPFHPQELLRALDKMGAVDS